MVGRTLMHYKVVAELGAGGMGVVYEAVDLRLNRRVALKILPAHQGDDEQRRARFLHEARTASALNDPHIVTIFDIFTADGTDVLVMELVAGRTLREILDEQPMPLADVLDIAVQVTDGVGTAHAAGIVHRDLKPGNVMVSPRGRVKVLDFGLAKQVGGALADQATTMATVSGMLMGTVDYMSPEQARGDAIDARSDIFSLGAMLYEMITGTRPFTSKHPIGVLHEIMYGAIPSVRTKRPEASADLERIVLRALERDVTARYQTMEALGSDLRQAQRNLLAGVPAAADAETRVFTPPPLPAPPPLPSPSPLSSPSPSPSSTVAQPAVFQPPTAGPGAGHVAESSGAVYPPLPPSSTAAPASPSHGTGWPRARRQKALRRKRRSRWVTVGIVLAVLWGFNWTRNVFNVADGDLDVVVPEVSSSSRVGEAVEEAVASGLLKASPNSAEFHLVSGRIYWKKAQRTKAPADVRKAEDTLNEALRLGLKDQDDEREARSALEEIAAMKKASEAPASEASPDPPSAPEPDTP